MGEKPWNLRKTLVVLLLLTLLAAFFDLYSGSVHLSLPRFLQALFSRHHTPFHTLLWVYRIPKMLTALLVGASVSTSGLLMQNLFRNPLAGPYILGVSSGASLGVALLVFLGFSAGWWIALSNWALVGAGVAGASLFLLVIGYLSFRVYETAALLITGVLLSAFAASIIGVLQYFSDQARLKTYVVWTFGSLSSLDNQQLSIFALITLLGLGTLFCFSKAWDTLLLGEDYAQSLGIPVRRMKVLLIVLTGLLVGVTTAFVGPILFIGIAIPYLARMLSGTARHSVLIPFTLLCGMASMLFFDGLSACLMREVVLPINLITAFFGAPVVLWLVIRGRNTFSL